MWCRLWSQSDFDLLRDGKLVVKSGAGAGSDCGRSGKEKE